MKEEAIQYYESANNLILAYDTIDEVLDHILYQVVDNKMAGNDEKLQQWLNIAYAVHELFCISNGDVTLH
jgi:hypothetical protein